jgi:GWxTD domain-containing protein
LSDPRFVRYTKSGPVPNPSQEIPIGAEGHVVRFTLHPDSGVRGACRLEWRFEDPDGRVLAERDTLLALDGGHRALEIPIPSERLALGKHSLTLRLFDSGGEREETRNATFNAKLTPEWFFLRRTDAFEVFEILGTPEEIALLEEASDDEWAGRVKEFWTRHDLDPDRSGNEYLEEIQSRMQMAARLFREPFLRPGWRTDRGRILLKFGPPSRRTLRGGGFEGPPTEIWEYDVTNRVFVFVDERGSGEFWLRG